MCSRWQLHFVNHIGEWFGCNVQLLMFGIGVGIRVGGRTASGSSPVPITATGGTITYSGGRTIHTFTSSGTFTVLTAPSGATVEALVVAGGGGGGNYAGGGGGAGGLLYTASKSISATAYAITVGSGGAVSVNEPLSGSNGNNSVFDTLIAIGGSGGSGAYQTAANGGSGGGGANFGNQSKSFGTVGQGNNGGNGGGNGGGGGGGASHAGFDNNGAGGDGLAYSISGSSVYYAGGGGSAGNSSGNGGLGGGGKGTNTSNQFNQNGQANTGGGGGAWWFATGPSTGNGGSGIVIISYPT